MITADSDHTDSITRSQRFDTSGEQITECAECGARFTGLVEGDMCPDGDNGIMFSIDK